MVHYGSRVIPFGDLFDEAIINDANKLTTIDALVEGGWDKTLGMVIYLGAKGSDKVWLGRWQDVYGVQVFSGPVQKSEGGFRCSDQEEMDALKASIMRHKFVGISTFEGIVGLHRNLPGEEWLFPENPTPCQRAYMEITMEMERSKKIKRLADDFIRRNFGAAPFLALHVRPYPDTCISLWKDKVRLTLQCDMGYITQ